MMSSRLLYGLLRVHVLVELMYQAEDDTGGSPSAAVPQFLTGACPWRLLIRDAAAREGTIDLAVEVVAVGHQKKCELRRRCAGAPFQRRRPWSTTCRFPVCARKRRASQGRGGQIRRVVQVLLCFSPSMVSGLRQHVSVNRLGSIRHFNHLVGQAASLAGTPVLTPPVAIRKQRHY